jgi:hypothetical protein
VSRKISLAKLTNSDHEPGITKTWVREKWQWHESVTLLPSLRKGTLNRHKMDAMEATKEAQSRLRTLF